MGETAKTQRRAEAAIARLRERAARGDESAAYTITRVDYFSKVMADKAARLAMARRSLQR